MRRPNQQEGNALLATARRWQVLGKNWVCFFWDYMVFLRPHSRLLSLEEGGHADHSHGLALLPRPIVRELTEGKFTENSRCLQDLVRKNDHGNLGREPRSTSIQNPAGPVGRSRSAHPHSLMALCSLPSGLNPFNRAEFCSCPSPEAKSAPVVPNQILVRTFPSTPLDQPSLC